MKDSNSTNIETNVQNYLNEKLGDDNNLKLIDLKTEKVEIDPTKEDKVSRTDF